MSLMDDTLNPGLEESMAAFKATKDELDKFVMSLHFPYSIPMSDVPTRCCTIAHELRSSKLMAKLDGQKLSPHMLESICMYILYGSIPRTALDTPSKYEIYRCIFESLPNAMECYDAAADNDDDAPTDDTNAICDGVGLHHQPLGISELALRYALAHDFIMNPKAKAAPPEFRAPAIIDRLHAWYDFCFIDGIPSVWLDGEWHSGWDAVYDCIISNIAVCDAKDRKEVARQLTIQDSRARSFPRADPRFISVLNGVLDTETLELHPHSREYHIPNMIKSTWDADAFNNPNYCPEVDAGLTTYADGDDDTLANFHDLLGLCIASDCDRANSFFVLEGESERNASLGKTTSFHAYIANMLDGTTEYVPEYSSNVLYIPFSKLTTDRFSPVRMVGKMVVFSDDDDAALTTKGAMSVMRTIVGGQPISVERKGEQGFTYRPTCQLIAAYNEFPRVSGLHDGTLRRIHRVSYKHHFDVTSVDAMSETGANTNFARTLDNDRARSRILAIAVEGLRELRANHYAVHHNKDNDDFLHDMQLTNSSVLEWLEDVGQTEDTLDGSIISELMDGYNKWCRLNNRQPVTRMELMRQIHNKFHGLQRGSKQMRLPLYMANLKGDYRANPDAYPRVSVINRVGSQAVKFVGEYGEFNPGYVYRMANGEPSTSDSTHNAYTNTTEPNN